MKPVIGTGTKQDHGFALGLLCIGGKFAGYTDCFLAWHPGDRFLPCRRIRFVVVIPKSHVSTVATVDSQVGNHQVKDCSDEKLLIVSFDFLDRNSTDLASSSGSVEERELHRNPTGVVFIETELWRYSLIRVGITKDLLTESKQMVFQSVLLPS